MIMETRTPRSIQPHQDPRQAGPQKPSAIPLPKNSQAKRIIKTPAHTNSQTLSALVCVLYADAVESSLQKVRLGQDSSQSHSGAVKPRHIRGLETLETRLRKPTLYVHTHTQAHTGTHRHTHKHTHTRTHTHTHTHTSSDVRNSPRLWSRCECKHFKTKTLNLWSR